MRTRMKIAASVAFLSVLVYFVVSGKMSADLFTSNLIGGVILAIAVAACLALISYYFDKNFNKDGSRKIENKK